MTILTPDELGDLPSKQTLLEQAPEVVRRIHGRLLEIARSEAGDTYRAMAQGQREQVALHALISEGYYRAAGTLEAVLLEEAIEAAELAKEAREGVVSSEAEGE